LRRGAGSGASTACWQQPAPRWPVAAGPFGCIWPVFQSRSPVAPRCSAALWSGWPSCSSLPRSPRAVCRAWHARVSACECVYVRAREKACVGVCVFLWERQSVSRPFRPHLSRFSRTLLFSPSSRLQPSTSPSNPPRQSPLRPDETALLVRESSALESPSSPFNPCALPPVDQRSARDQPQHLRKKTPLRASNNIAFLHPTLLTTTFLANLPISFLALTILRL